METTLLVFQLPIGWLKLIAQSNRCCILFTLLISQLEISELNLTAPWNILIVDQTLLVYWFDGKIIWLLKSLNKPSWIIREPNILLKFYLSNLLCFQTKSIHHSIPVCLYYLSCPCSTRLNSQSLRTLIPNSINIRSQIKSLTCDIYLSKAKQTSPPP